MMAEGFQEPQAEILDVFSVSFRCQRFEWAVLPLSLVLATVFSALERTDLDFFAASGF
jgi:hypothetical protein